MKAMAEMPAPHSHQCSSHSHSENGEGRWLRATAARSSALVQRLRTRKVAAVCRLAVVQPLVVAAPLMSRAARPARGNAWGSGLSSPASKKAVTAAALH